jgi:pimeloyl-ACP methyl ester carboxylesterase
MMRRILIAAGVPVALALCALGAIHLAIRHQRLPLFDVARNRSVPVDLYVRRDKEMEAEAGMKALPVAILLHGNTVRNTEYAFLADALAARGYLVASIQNDLPTDPPLSMKGYPYEGRLAAYERGVANIDFVIKQLRQREPIADYDKLTLIGHSQGGDIAVYYAAGHPNTVTRLVTLDNLRVPLQFVRAKILSFRSRGGIFKPDPGVVPGEAARKADDIEVVMTGAQHTDLSDRGPETLKQRIVTTLSKFLDDEKPLPKRARSAIAQYAPGAPY